MKSITMKHRPGKLILTSIICLHYCFAAAQQKCSEQPLFNTMPNHSVRNCEEKEFDKLELRQADKTKRYIDITKEGAYISTIYKFDGEWEKRPSPLQICQNYINAIQKAGGEILYKTDGYASGKLKKSNAVYWIEVSSDGSGDYRITSIKEEKMKQDIVVTADEIRKNMKEEGKVVFYGIYFDTDKSSLKSESTPTLTEIAKFLKTNLSMTVFIVGHTDNSGDYNHNLQLSKDRAAAVINELVMKYSINKSQVIAQGVGPLSPVASNVTEEGKSRNRRVEIVLR